MKRFLCVAGARPNFMKVAPICRALDAREGCTHVLLHTGQHYDERMSRLFFTELGLPEPAINLGVGGGTHGQQTAAVMERFEPALREVGPDHIVVVGDVNSTLACALVAAKLGVPVAHVEAGLRSFDRSMPEETNRVLTDALSDLLFASEPAGVANLRREGIPPSRIHFVGNVMIDTLLRHRERARGSPILGRLGLSPGQYALLTLHRPSNVDRREALVAILDAFEVIQRTLPIVFPIHPRTAKSLEAFGLFPRLAGWDGLVRTKPLGYLDFLCLMEHAAIVLTDSGGIQEETTVLGVPCLTLRENTERPATILQGTNQLVGRDAERILRAFRQVVDMGRSRPESLPELWDGRAAERIADILLKAGS
jgi:UDP-N-acetylglucosamine 2-epimerase (non-hydrolysing)